MTSQEALEILVDNPSKYGMIDDMRVVIMPEDIKENLRWNDFELNLEWIQDLTYIVDGDFNMLQGHSLGAVEF